MKTKTIKLMNIAMAYVFCISTAYAKDIYQSDIPNDQSNKLDKCVVFINKNQTNKAIKKIEKILDKSPEYYRAHYNLGLAYVNAKKYDKAIKHLEKSMLLRNKYNIKDATAYNPLGVAYLKKGEYGKAEKILFEGLEYINDMTELSKQKIYNNIGVLYMFMGKYDESEKYLKISANSYKYETAANNLKLLYKVMSKK